MNHAIRMFVDDCDPQTLSGAMEVLRAAGYNVSATGDVTSLALIERQNSEMKLVLDAVPAIVFYKDLDGRFILVNRELAQLVGLPPEAFIGKTDADLGSPHAQEYRKIDLQVMSTGESVRHIEEQIYTVSGPRWLMTDKVPHRDNNGRIKGVIGFAVDITERKRAEERAAWLGTFPERNPNPIVEIDIVSGVVHYLNPAAAQFFPDLKSQGRMHPLFDGLQEQVDILLKNKTQSVSREIMVGRLYFAQSITYIPEAQWVRVYSTDITELRKAELALRLKEEQLHESDRRLAEIVHGMTEACFALDAEWRFIFVNDQLETLLKHSREQLLGQSIWKVFSKLINTPMEQHYRRAMTQRTPVKFEALSPIAGRWLDVRLFPSGDGLAAFLLDIDDRKKTEASRQASESRYRALFESAPIGILIADTESYYIDGNPSICGMLGYTRDEFIGLHASDIVIESEIEHIAPALSLIKAKSEYIREWHFRRKDGSTFEAEVTVTVLPDGNLLGMIRDITERKKAVEAKERALQRLNEAQRIGQIGDWEYDIATQAIAWSPQVFEILGRDSSLGPPKNYEENAVLYDEVSRGIVDEKVALAIQSGEPQEFELVAVREDGGHIHVRAMAVPRKDSSGKVFGLYGTIQNISERKRSEQALHESAMQFQTMVNSIPQLAWIAHADGFIFWYNKRWHDYTGTTPEQMEGWGWQSVHDPNVLPKVLEKWRNSIAVGQPFEMEFPLLGADGRFRTFLTRVHPMKDTQGRVLQWFGTNTDVDALKQMEASQRETQARLNSTLAAGLIGTWTWDIINNRLYADEFTSRIFSLDYSDAVKGLPVERFVEALHAEDRAEVVEALDRAIKICGYYDVQYRVRQPDEGICWLQARGRVECDSTGNAMYFHGAVMDITERKQAENEIRRLNAELENRVNERTAQLQSANKELEAFSYSVSHDLRAPLRAVDGYSRAVLEDYGPKLPDEGRGYLQSIRKGAQQMGSLIDDLLKFSRLSRAPLKKIRIETEMMVRAVLEDLRFQTEGRKIEFRITELPPCDGDPALLRQVWVNLLSNAIKYTGKSEAALIEIGCTLDKGVRVYYVRDNGTGFDMRYADKLFNVFQRLHRAEDYEGTGVGLALVHRILARHGGRIWADAEVNRGATFNFTLEGAES